MLGLALFVAFAAVVQRTWPARWPQRVEDTLAPADLAPVPVELDPPAPPG